MRGLSPSLRALQRAFWKQGQNGAKSALAEVNNRDKYALCEGQKLQKCEAWRHENSGATRYCQQCDASTTGPQECNAGLLGGCPVQGAYQSSG